MKRRVVRAAVLAAAGLWLLSAETSRSSMDGVYSEAQAKRGRELYADQCIECHGHDLEGKYESAPLAGDEFRNHWEGLDLDKLFERIHTTMTGDAAGMISTGPPKPLTRGQTADLVAFLLYFNGMPAGKTDLGTKAEVLETIRFESPKP
ncbi:MAG TPA: cytochrome c [Bryobacteraceae bacterium]|nr:cytochrome c [Bryobacteraceae bacterium]